MLQRPADSMHNMTTAPEKADAEPGRAAAQGSSITAGLYLLLVIALLDERGPNGPGGNGIHTDAALNQMCCQTLCEGGDSSLHVDHPISHP